jgi:ubiquinone/menaquinone biosynthesis C-methylase UbiE/uncharacterized protein YbaR (Trm112 family)
MNSNQQFLKANLICLRCKNENLSFFSDKIECNKCNYEYKIISDIPILIDENKNDSVYHLIDKRIPDKNINQKNDYGIYKFIEENIKGTSGYLYQIKNLKKYPIPKIEIIDKYLKDKIFLDIGCGWGRWTISSSKLSKLSVGVDVSIDSLICANNIAKEMNLNCIFIYADIRNLPFKNNTFDTAFSYSVLQHLSSFHVYRTLKSIHRSLKNNGYLKFQLMNKFALRNLFIQLKRGFREPQGFEVRYHNPSRFKKMINKFYFDINQSNCSFFTQARIEDFSYLSFNGKVIILFSFIFNKLSKYLIKLSHLSENIYISCKK